MVFGKKGASFKGDGIIISQDVPQAIQAEKVIKTNGYEVKLVAPPPEFRIGCDLALEVNLVESAGIERLLKDRDVPYIGIYPLMTGTAALCEIVKVTDYGQFKTRLMRHAKCIFGQEGLKASAIKCTGYCTEYGRSQGRKRHGKESHPL